MEIVNAVLLMCALILVWGAINLERPAAQRVEVNQSDQLNDSINFLKKLKKPSAKERSQDRRAQAFKSHVDSVSEEIPRTMDSIEESFDQIQYGQRRKGEATATTCWRNSLTSRGFKPTTDHDDEPIRRLSASS